MQKIWSEKKLVAKATRESFDFFRETWFSNGLLLGGDRAIGTIDDRFLHFRRKKNLDPSQSCMTTFSKLQRSPGLPDFSWYMIPKPEKMNQMNKKCTKWS
jgi:hypothetical protein